MTCIHCNDDIAQPVRCGSNNFLFSLFIFIEKIQHQPVTVLLIGRQKKTFCGGNLTPVGASANIAAIGILRREGYTVRNRDFFRIGMPFTLCAVCTGYLMLWLLWA
jgi:uncharacterized membrane protein YoaK (UPF0700 family)